MSAGSNAEFDVVVTGGSLPALQAALDFAELGLSVVVLSAQNADALAPHHEPDPEGALAALMQRVAAPIERGEGATLESVLPARTPAAVPMLPTAAGQWSPQAEPNLLGIPAVTLAAETLRLLGTAAALRAYLDRLRPLLTVGKTRTLGKLVRARLGRQALQRLVEPQVFERYGVSADQLEVAVAAPGLNEALTRTGALSSAVLAYSDRHAAREARVAPADGWQALHVALRRRLEFYGAELRDDSLEALHTRGEGWEAELNNGATIGARAIVLDQGESPLPRPGLGAYLESLLPDFVRMHAEIDIERVDWLAPGDSALAISGAWALRLESAESGLARARLVCDAADIDVLRQTPDGVDAPKHRFEPGGAPLIAELDAALAAVSVRPSADAKWSFRLAAAPFATLIEHEVLERSLDALSSEHPTLLAVGRALHGDDLAAALASANRRGIVLRRRLLGLDE